MVLYFLVVISDIVTVLLHLTSATTNYQAVEKIHSNRLYVLPQHMGVHQHNSTI